ncbi:MAG: hypothetical protein HZA20_03855 [Nitrospirae bacterium]|nr:hypothetical protein [Nitrospirota bacterium]
MERNELLDKGRNLALGIPRDEWRVMIREMVYHLTEDRRKDLQRYIRQATASDKRWFAMDEWFEAYFRQNPTARPKTAAKLCCHYHTIDKAMTKKLAEIARRVKTRLRIRGIRAKEKLERS